MGQPMIECSFGDVDAAFAEAAALVEASMVHASNARAG